MSNGAPTRTGTATGVGAPPSTDLTSWYSPVAASSCDHMTVPFQAATRVGACSVLRTVAACAAATGARAALTAAPARRTLRKRWDMTSWCRTWSAVLGHQGDLSPHPSGAE